MYNASSQRYDRLIADSMVPQSPHVALGYTGVLTMSMSNPIEQALERSILDQDRLLTLPEIADFIRVTPHALHMQRLRNQAPGNLGFKVGARVLFKSEDIRAWLDEKSDQARERL